MIEFHCNNCGSKFKVPEVQAGKKGRCPKCKNVVVVPGVGQTSSVPEPGNSEKQQKDSRRPGYDLTLLEAPIAGETQEKPTVESGQVAEETEKITQGSNEYEEESGTERRFPWPVDVLFYPANKPGLTILSIIIVVRWFSIIVIRNLGFSTPSLSPMVVIVVPLVCISIIVRIILYLYFLWYLCECIRDSAEGGLRAPETVGRTPGFGEMFWVVLRTSVPFVIFAGPVLGYYLSNRNADTTFWALLAYASLFLPMVLLAVVMFDSISGLNPILLINSIRSTFLPYFAMISGFYAAVFIIINNIPEAGFTLAWKFVIHCAVMYLLMVTAHLLGRFYNRYEHKLNWEV